MTIFSQEILTKPLDKFINGVPPPASLPIGGTLNGKSPVIKNEKGEVIKWYELILTLR